MTDYTLPGPNGSLPNIAAFGFNWKPMQKLLTERARLWGELRETDFRYRELEGQISVMERAEFEALADSYRDGGNGPDGANVAKARAELERMKKKARALGRALEKVDAEIMGVVRKHAPEWRREVDAKAKERADAVEDAVHRLRKAQAELYAMSALGGWLENPRKSFGFGTGPRLVQTFTHRDVRLPEVFDAIVSDAREKSGTPQERERQRWSAMGATATPSPGWVA